MSGIPRIRQFDSTFAFGRDPYRFISSQCQRLGTDIFEARIGLRKTVCLRGNAAAKLVCDLERFQRSDAAPRRIVKTLFGTGGVQGLDGAAHRHRKAMFLSITAPEHVERLCNVAECWWRVYARKWAAMDRVVLYSELQEILCRAVCEWAGVSLAESDVGRRTRQLTLLFDAAGGFGPKHWLARWARRRADRWSAGIIKQIRNGQVTVSEGDAGNVIARHRDLNGELLGTHVAAVELLNVLRPIVAVSVYIVFIAHALNNHPEYRQQVDSGDERFLTSFVQEVRRFYPFFPVVAARVRRDCEWRGYPLVGGRRVLLDLYGTNHDERLWEEPEKFRPQRFLNADVTPFNFIPQGGGDHQVNHRCPGEGIAVELMKRALRFLVTELEYQVPSQDLTLDFGRLPSAPRSRFILCNASIRRERNPSAKC